MQRAKFLKSYEFEILYQIGKDNTVADNLSRVLLIAQAGPVPKNVEATIRNIIYFLHSYDLSAMNIELSYHRSSQGSILFYFNGVLLFKKDMLK